MPHLFTFRKGWQSEHLARYIISQFSFIAEPSNISDDLGSDFFCTLFTVENNKFLSPKSSFAIQIKSNRRKFDITNKSKYIEDLEIPYFVGVVDRKKLKLTIYSGEGIDHFFTQNGNPYRTNKIFIKLIEEPIENHPTLHNFVDDDFFIYFPKVIELDVNLDYPSNPEKINKLLNVCKLTQKNISSRHKNQYIYNIYGVENASVYAGSGSVQTYEQNFLNQVTEALFNLQWIIQHRPADFDLSKYEVYENIYHSLEENNFDLPELLIDCYARLSVLVEQYRTRTNL